MMRPPALSKVTIRTLRHNLQTKRFAVPKLQRNFVWDPGRAAKLLDSIFQDMPIGSLFLWEMDRKSAGLIRQSTAEILPQFNSSNKTIWFVIDGQQRLSVIYQAFEGERKENDVGRKIDFGRLCFVVEPDQDVESPPRVVYRKPVDRQFAPVKDILAPDWRRRFAPASKKYLAKLKDFRDQVLRYPVPIVTVQGATLEQIGEIFIRVNSQGMRITSADRAVALMGKLDVRAMAQELRQKVRESGFQMGGIDSILMGFNLVTERPNLDGDPPKLDAMARRWEKKLEGNEREKAHFGKLWHQYQRAFQTAVDYLRHRFPVYDETFLPSANMLAVLSVFFFNHRGQPNRHQADEICKWFWATGVAQRYTGRGYHRNLMMDTKLFASLARGAKSRFVFRDYLDPVLIQTAEYGSRSTRARAFFCLLALQRPRYLEGGESIPLESEVLSHANRKHRHHIFPQAQLRARVSSRAYNSLCNICFLVSRDNTMIGSQLPRRYLAQFRDQGREGFRRTMKSHLIPVGDDSGVWDRGVVTAYKKFRRNRLRLLCAAFERAAGMRLFKRIQAG